MSRYRLGFLVAPAILLAVAAPARAHWSASPGDRVVAAQSDGPPVCAPGGDTVVIEGTAAAEEESTYRLLPFEVADGTTRLELHYDYGDADPLAGQAPQQDTVVDIGLWDRDGTEGPAAFRGWGGSHHGVISKGRPPIWIQADSAHRGFGGGAIEPGTWHAEVGFGNVNPGGGWYRVELTCLDPDVGPEPAPDPVDRDHVADPEPGWYHGDFHMHAFHSSPDGPTHAEVVRNAREVGLDFLPITEYVTTWHHETWGATARANPDLVVWPSREVITYDGHAIVLGETPSVVEYRDGFRQITMAEIQRLSLGDGAEFGIAHPTIFPEPLLGDFCRGCEAQYLDEIDLDEVLTIEVLTGPVAYDASYLGGPSTGPQVEFPFMQTAVDLWEELLLDGHRITAVSGTDSKSAEGHGENATAVYAEALSRPALIDALERQRAYVRTRGVAHSPELELTASDGTDEVMIGGTLTADQATMRIVLRGAMGHTVDLIRNGTSAGLLPVPTDPFTAEVPIVRTPDEGPLGTFWRVDVRDPQGIRSIVSNPLYLAGDADGDGPSDDGDDRPPGSPTPGEEGGRGAPTPVTGGALFGPVAIALAAAGSRARRRS